MKRLAIVAALASATALTGTGPLHAADEEVNVYSTRQEFLMRPFLEEFTAATGIQVNVVFIKEGLLERLEAEGRNSPADLALTVDIARLDALADAGLLQPVQSQVLNENIPAQFRHPDGLWYGLTTRARIIYASKERVPQGSIKSYEELAEPEWEGRVCMRSSKHPYNRALLASIIAAHGEEKARQWAEGLKANMARKPQSSDRGQVKAVKEGLCDVALGNSYYYGAMKFNEKEPEQKSWAEAVYLVFPNQEGRGTHVNISGVGMTKAAPNREAALKLMEFLSGETAQRMYASVNFEYPVNPDVKWDPEVASWGRFEADDLSLQEIAELSPKAAVLFNEVGFD